LSDSSGCCMCKPRLGASSVICRLGHLYLRRNSLKFMTPLQVHRPCWTLYKWGHTHNAPGQVLRATTSCHDIVQPNYFECEFALLWQSLQRQHKLGKKQLCQDLQEELVRVLLIYLQVRRCFWAHVFLLLFVALLCDVAHT